MHQTDINQQRAIAAALREAILELQPDLDLAVVGAYPHYCAYVVVGWHTRLLGVVMVPESDTPFLVEFIRDYRCEHFHRLARRVTKRFGTPRESTWPQLSEELGWVRLALDCSDLNFDPADQDCFGKAAGLIKAWIEEIWCKTR